MRETRSKGVVVLAVGLPGSGKSAWFERHGIRPLSSDHLRGLLLDDETDQSRQSLVFRALRFLLRMRLLAGRPATYVDATHLTRAERRPYIRMARQYGYAVAALFFDAPLKVCLDRNRRRRRSVPEEAMLRMAGKLRPPSYDEGFQKITVIRK